MGNTGISFWRGTQANYGSIEKNPNCIYFILDEFKIYLGTIEISNNKEVFLGMLLARYNDVIDTFTWR